MLQTLGDIFDYTKDILLQGEISEISEIIEYLEEAQQIISEKVPIEAPIYSFTLTTNQFNLPTDFYKFRKLKIDDVEVQPEEQWNGVIYLSDNYETGSFAAKLYYYKKPTALNPNTLSQVPDIDPKYYPQMAKYAAEMYYLVDDDSEMQQQFREKFNTSVGTYSNANNSVSRFKNIW